MTWACGFVCLYACVCVTSFTEKTLKEEKEPILIGRFKMNLKRRERTS